MLTVIAQLPDDTDLPSLVLRGSVGLAIGLFGVMVVRRMLGALADPPPPMPDTVDARSTEVVYECSSCGTIVRLELASIKESGETKAPRHCGEEMEPSLRAR